MTNTLLDYIYTKGSKNMQFIAETQFSFNNFEGLLSMYAQCENPSLEALFMWDPYIFPTKEFISEKEAEILYKLFGQYFDTNCRVLLSQPKECFTLGTGVDKLIDSLKLFKLSEPALQLLNKLETYEIFSSEVH